MTTITEDGTTFDGSDGADSIAVLANRVRVNAGRGDDWISAILDVVAGPGEDADGDGYPDSADPEEISTELYGGAGDDRIHASIRGVDVDFFGLSIVAQLFGGTGNDQIRLDIENNQAEFNAAVIGGAGADNISVTADSDGDSSSGGGSVAVDAGDGDDTIGVNIRGGSRSGGGDVTVHAGNGNDYITAFARFVEPDGNVYGACFLYGGSGNDTLNGGGTGNNANGGSGNDRIVLDGNGNTAFGGSGNDWIKVASWVGINVFGGDGSGGSVVSGGTGDDTIRAALDFTFSGIGTSEIQGGDGSDRLSATITFALDPDDAEYASAATGLNKIEGGNGDDRLSGVVKVTGDLPDGSDLHSELYGGSGNDRLSVRGGEGNVLDGGSGADVLLGSEGVDILDGGGHADYMRGRGGADIFRFEIGDSSARNRDRIADFEIGSDVIDLSQIDANVARRGDQAFIVDGTEGRGHAWFVEDPDSTGTILMADNGRRVLEVLLIDGRGVEADHYSASDFLL